MFDLLLDVEHGSLPAVAIDGFLLDFVLTKEFVGVLFDGEDDFLGVDEYGLIELIFLLLIVLAESLGFVHVFGRLRPRIAEVIDAYVGKHK